MPKSSRGFHLGIVNPTTLAGAEVKAILEERGIQYDRIDLLDSTGEHSGELTDVGDEAAVQQQLSEDNLELLDIVFFTGPAETNRKWLAIADAKDCLSIDLSTPDFGTREGIPVVAGVNTDAIVQDTGRLVSAHPAAIPLILILDRVRSISPVTLGVATIVQPASHLGKDGIDELFQQTIQALNMKDLPTDVFERQAAFNLYPAADGVPVEAMIRSDLTAILGHQTVAVSLVQGPSFHGHSMSIFIQTENDISVEDLRKALLTSGAIEIEDDVPAGTVDAGGRDSVLVGRISRDSSSKNGFWIWAVCDNLRRGAALNAVAVAETVIREFQWTN